jgi:16S rRNA (uracil1498-N3)-methyltransferase
MPPSTTAVLRLFLPTPLHAGADIAPTPAQAHYLGTVMRRGVGDPVEIFNGTDGAWEGRITALKRDRATIALLRQTRAQTPEPDLWLVFAALKRDATDLVVQKATELGVSALLPAFTDHGVAARVNTARLAAIATEAAEQSERLSVPRIAEPRRLSDILADWPEERLLVAAIERAQAAPIRPARGKAALLVGPEGGFSAAELDALRRCTFVQAASLGPRILRAETACIAGLALLQANRREDGDA